MGAGDLRRSGHQPRFNPGTKLRIIVILGAMCYVEPVAWATVRTDWSRLSTGENESGFIPPPGSRDVGRDHGFVLKMPETLFHHTVFFIQDACAFFVVHFANRSILEWILFFFPFYVFGEFPRYVLPSIALMLLAFLGYFRRVNAAAQRFLATPPSVSILLVGRNEEATIGQAIESLLQIDYPKLEIIFVDDASDDRTYAIAKPFAERGLIKLYRNSAATGRTGRPSGSNYAFAMSSGDYIVSVDADTTFDRDMLRHMLGPFHDPEVGVVAGNLKARNAGDTLWTRAQAIEYAQSITLWKTWLDVLGWNMQASGALGAFRREAIVQAGGWDSETAEDADLSLKIKKGGWKLVFAPKAVAFTDVPPTLRQLVNQRNLWDRGFFRTYFRKHVNLMNVRRFRASNASEMALEFFFQVLLAFIYLTWFVYMLVFYPVLLCFILPIVYAYYTVSMAGTYFAAFMFSERKREEWPLFFTIPFMPLYKGLFRWVRIYALTLEYFRINQEHGYLPVSAWRNTPRW